VRVVVVGAGMAGLTAAHGLQGRGDVVTVLDKGRRPGGRLATRNLAGGARADHGAQFFTVRSDEFAAAVSSWAHRSLVHEWCRGFGSADGNPRYATGGGMAELASSLAAGLDVRTSTHVDAVRRAGRGWEVSWRAGHGATGGSTTADAVVLTAPVPQSAGLVAGHAEAPVLEYTPTLALLVVVPGGGAVPAPGGVQLDDDPVWSWVGDNAAKGTSPVPAVTLHARADVSAARYADEEGPLVAELLASAAPWLGTGPVGEVVLHRWRYAAPVSSHAARCVATDDGTLVWAGDAFGGPKVEGAFLSGLAAAGRLEG